MSDRDKVFDAVRNCITEPKCRDCPWEECEKFEVKKVKVPVSLMLDVLNLLKEQDPVPVKLDGEYTNIKYGHCPNCGEGLNSEVYPNWCGFCGQAVTWE